jgi:hypothetical protein
MLLRFFRCWLATPCWLGVCVAVAIVLTLTSLGVGLQIDDYWHYLAFVDVPGLSLTKALVPHSRFDLFAFCDGDPVRTSAIVSQGVLPWWTDPTLKAAFWRPVASLTHWVDYTCWPNLPWLMHVQSILWYGAAVLGVGLCYRKVMGPTWIAGLAALIYAIDDGHAVPVGFLANRNSILATFFGSLAVLAHIKWRVDGWKAGRVLGPVLLAVALLSAEAGVGTIAYLIAYALVLDHAGWRRGMLSLWGFASVIVVWRLAWQGLGYGISTGVGFYVDPLREPIAFAMEVIVRGPILMFGQWFGGSDASILLQGATLLLFWAAALVLSVAVLSATAGVVRERATARFWFLGMMLALVPICSAIAGDRMLVFVGIGGAGLLAEFFGWVGRNRKSWTGFRRTRLVGTCGVLLFVHLVVAPVALAWRSGNPLGPHDMMESMKLSIPDVSWVEQQEVIVVNTPFLLTLSCSAAEAALAGKPIPRRALLLGPSATDLAFMRIDERTVSIRPEGGYLVAPFDRLFRGRSVPFAVGDRVPLGDIVVEITELTDDRRPAEARFRFAQPLESPDYQWVKWTGSGYEPFDLPDVGQSVDLPCPWPGF